MTNCYEDLGALAEVQRGLTGLSQLEDIADRGGA
jgi:hypothetical protein